MSLRIFTTTILHCWNTVPVRSATSDGQMKMMHKEVQCLFTDKTAVVQVLPSPSMACQGFVRK